MMLTSLDELDAMAIQLPYMGGRAVMEILLLNERLVCYATTCASKSFIYHSFQTSKIVANFIKSIFYQTKGRVARAGRRFRRIRL